MSIGTGNHKTLKSVSKLFPGQFC